MRYLVTGAAGFIGSHLCERLLALGHEVTGLDTFIPYYPRPLKERNLVEARKHAKFRFLPLDLRIDDLKAAVEGAEVVFHLAAMPGLVASWTDFDLYLGCNVTATQRLLEAVKGSRALQRFVYGSTSSVYGKFASGDETLPTKPVSPYGVTKLAGEHGPGPPGDVRDASAGTAVLLRVRPPATAGHGLQHLHPGTSDGRADHRLRRRAAGSRQHVRLGLRGGRGRLGERPGG